MNALDYILGCDVIGATAAPLGSDRAVVVRPRDISAAVKARGGATGSIALRLVPETVANEFYSQLSTQLRDELKKQGIDADVYVVATPPLPGGAIKSDFVGGAVVGAVGATAIYGVSRLVRYFHG